MAHKSLSHTLVQFLWELEYEQIPAEVIDYTKLLMIDYFASAAAGYKVNASANNAILNVVKKLDHDGVTPVLFSQHAFSFPNAAFLNAAYAHGADMDDGHRVMGGHPGSPVISAVLAAASGKKDLSGKDILLAIICGYEAMIRIGAAVQPGHVGRGFHSTGTAGTIGAAIGCAKLLCQSYQRFYNAMSLATVHASGLMSVTESGQAAKPLNAARAAYTGTMCALFANEGIPGPDDPLESPKGFFRAFGDNIRQNAVTDSLGVNYQICGCYIKPYPTCRATHAGAEAAAELREQITNIGRIKEIRLFIYPRAIFIAGDKSNHVPQRPDSCKFSLAFAIACALHRGTIGINDIINFAPQKDHELLETCTKIHLIEDPSTEDVLHGKRGCRLEIEMNDNSVLKKDIALPKGDPEVPMSFEDCRKKLSACAVGLLSETQQNNLFGTIMNLDRENIYNDIVSWLHSEK